MVVVAAGQVGHFGEGLKLGLVVLCDNEYNARIETDGERWQFTFDGTDELHNFRTMKQNWEFKRYSIEIYAPVRSDTEEVRSYFEARGRFGIDESLPSSAVRRAGL
jgi:hypothetical protein